MIPRKDMLSFIQVYTHGDQVRVQRTIQGRVMGRSWLGRFCDLLEREGWTFKKGSDAVSITSTVDTGELADAIRLLLLSNEARNVMALPIERQKSLTSNISTCWTITDNAVKIGRCVQKISILDNITIKYDNNYVWIRREKGSRFHVETLAWMIEQQIAEHYYW